MSRRRGRCEVCVKNCMQGDLEYIELWHEYGNDGWKSQRWENVGKDEVSGAWAVEYNYGVTALKRDWWMIEVKTVDGLFYHNITKGNTATRSHLVVPNPNPKAQDTLLEADNIIYKWRPKVHLLTTEDHGKSVVLTVSETTFQLTGSGGGTSSTKMKRTNLISDINKAGARDSSSLSFSAYDSEPDTAPSAHTSPHTSPPTSPNLDSSPSPRVTWVNQSSPRDYNSMFSPETSYSNQSSAASSPTGSVHREMVFSDDSKADSGVDENQSRALPAASFRGWPIPNPMALAHALLVCLVCNWLQDLVPQKVIHLLLPLLILGSWYFGFADAAGILPYQLM